MTSWDRPELDWYAALGGRCPLTRLGHVAEVIAGHPFSSNRFTPGGTGRRVVRIRDILHDDDVITTDEAGPTRALLRDGDILIGMDGDYNVCWWDRGDAALNQRISLVRARQYDQRFMYYCLPAALRAINDLTYGTTVKHLSMPEIRRIGLPAIPLDEQRRIADFLDRETARIDELAASMDAADHLYRERFARRLRWVFGGERARGTDPFKAFAEAAKGTPRRLGASGMWLSGGTPPRGTAGYWDGAVPWCSSKDLRRYNIDDTEEHISEAAIKHAGWIPTDGVLVSTRGMSLAKRLPVAKVARAMAFNQDLKGIVLSAMWNPDYVLMCLRAAEPDILALCEQASHGTYKLPTAALQRFQIPHLPHEEQRELVRAVLKHERRQKLLSATRRRQVGLLREYRRALITEAVTGQLDPRRMGEPAMEERMAEVVS